MKLRKIVSGILACAMILSSVPAAAIEAQDEAGGQQGPHISYVVPQEGGIPIPARVSAGDEHYEVFEDRAKNPAVFTDVSPTEEKKIENLDGIWGFNGRIKSEANNDKFDVTGNTPMVIAFKLYLKKMGSGNNDQVILSKGDNQYCITLTSRGIKFHSYLNGWREEVFSNCFKTMNRWYDVVLVKDGDQGVRFYVDDQASPVYDWRALSHCDDPFAVGTQMYGETARRNFTSDYGYVADVKFYNGAAMEEDDAAEFEETVNLRTLDALEDDGVTTIYKMLESTLPTADLSFRPYRTVTKWTETGSTEALTEEFKCGTEYTATTTLTVRDGESFRFTDAMAETLRNDMAAPSVVYHKIPSEQLTGTADSETIGHAKDGDATKAVDGKENTYWHSSYNGQNEVNLGTDPKQNNTYTITLENPQDIAKFVYVPRSDGGNGVITNADLSYSTTADGDDFQDIKQNIAWTYDTSTKEVVFDTEIKNVKRIRITANSAHSDQSNRYFLSAAEFYLYSKEEVSAPGAAAVVSDDKTQMTVTVSYEASAVPCTHQAETVSVGSLIDMEEGKTRQLTPQVIMDDGKPMASHKGFAAGSIQYAYASDTPAVAAVNESGLVTAAAEGKAKITVTATLPKQNPIQMEVDVQVFKAGSMFLHPEMKYMKPAVGNYPEVAEIWLNREQEDSFPTLITDVAPGEAKLVLVEGTAEPSVVKKEGLIAFNGQYKSTKTQNQFNVTGANPLVIMFKLWVDKLPTGTNGDTERAIVTKGNQFSFAIKNDSDTGRVPKLRLGMKGIGNNWPLASYTIPENWTGQWHDIVIVFDGKGTKNSMGFFVDGEFIQNGTENEGTIGNDDNVGSSDGDPLRPFTICGKAEETGQVFTKENGYLAGLKFFDVKNVAPELVDDINLNDLGNEHGAARIKYMLDAKDRTAHITATPYKMQTTWSVAGENTVLDGNTPFTAENIRDKGYTATTVLTAYGDFVFDAGEVEHITDDLRHIYVDPEIDATLIRQTAEISADNKVLTVKVTFLPRKMQAPSITYTSPIPDGTPRRQPISNDGDKAQYTMANSVWSVVGGAAMGEDDKFAPITDSNKYQVQTVLTTKGDYLFDNSAEFIKEAKENIRTQRFGNVDANVDVAVADDGSTMTITVTYEKPIYMVSFLMNGATSAAEPMQSISSGNVPNKPEDPTKDGSEFVCWYVDGDESQAEYDFTKPIAGHVALAAKWARSINVIINSGVEGSNAEIVAVQEGSKLERPKTPQNGTKTFLGWYVKVDDNYSLYDFDTPVTEAMTLYGLWQDDESPTTVQVKFMDGETELERKDVTVGKTVTLPEEPTKDNYRFAGWFLDEECTQPFNAESPVVSNMTLYAKWTPVTPGTESVVINSEAFTLKIGETKKLTVTVTPEDQEVVFHSGNDQIASVDENGMVTGKSAGTVKIKAALKSNEEISDEVSVTVEADGAEKTKYTVTFDSKGGSAVEAQTVEAGALAAAPQNPTKAGYTFDGWFTDEAFQKAYDFSTPVNSSFTLYAKWKKEGALEKGAETFVGGLGYTVLDPDKRTVAISKGMLSTKKKIKVPGKIKAGEFTYTVIGVANKAFKNNKKINQITLPASVKSVGTQAFAGCKNLKKVILQGKTFKPGKSSFKGTSSKLKIKAKKMSKKQRAKLQTAIRKKGKNKKAKVTK